MLTGVLKGLQQYLGELTVLPAPDPEEVPHHIALLLAVKLRYVLVRTHDWTV